MENIIQIIEDKIEQLQSDIDWREKKLKQDKTQKADLELELESLKVKLGED
jgi:hypothetical protein